MTPFVVGISGSPSATSHSRTLLELALTALERHSGSPARRIDLAQLPADGLLGRRQDRDVLGALRAVEGAGILVVSSPIYRATYSGLLKVFFDLLPQDALEGAVAIPIATGGGPGHFLAIDHGLRPLLASLGALVTAGGIYATDSQFTNGAPQSDLATRIERAVLAAASLTPGVTA